MVDTVVVVVVNALDELRRAGPEGMMTQLLRLCP